jgi:hypothetical protein
MQEIKLQITPQKKSKKLYKIYTLTRVVKTTPYLCIVKLEVITSKIRTEYDGNFDYYRYGGKRIGLSLRWQEQYI